MLCSVPSGKGGGGSKWLDRLRSSKGFPIPDNVLDLSHQNNNNKCDADDSSPDPNSDGPGSSSPDNSQNPKSSFAVITGILSDLFYITPSSSSSNCRRKVKFGRKQSSPKIFSLIPNNQHQPHLVLSSNSHNPDQHPDEEEEDDDDDKQPLFGFSKTEVTVIDTSSSDIWKSDKLIFRRNHVWKIKDKKKQHHPKHFRRNNKTKCSPNSHLRPQITAANQSLKPFNQEYNAEHCSVDPEMSANAPDSSNDKKQNACTLLQENGSYYPEKKVNS